MDKLIMCLYWETIMLSEVRPKNGPQEFGHVCVDE